MSRFDKEIDLVFTGIDPWEHAKQMYAEWEERKKEIEKIGRTDAYATLDRDSEHTSPVDFAVLSQTGVDENFNSITDFSPTSKYNTMKDRFGDNLMRTTETIDGYAYEEDDASLEDVYGGYTPLGKMGKATGYFHVEFINGRFWVIDPLGYPFFRASVSTVSPTETMQAKYESRDAWARDAMVQLRRMGFNSVGAWSDIASISLTERPTTLTANTGTIRAYALEKGFIVNPHPVTAVVGGVLPVFDPEFVEFAEKQLEEYIAPYVNNPFVFGWMSDNEMPALINMLDKFLEIDPTFEPHAYSYATAWNFMYMKTGKKDVSAEDLTDELRDEFRGMMYDRYYHVVANIIRRIDPNHMYLGTRFAHAYDNKLTMQIAGYYFDVTTINYYLKTTPDTKEIQFFYNNSGKPFMFTEWYSKGMDACSPETLLTNKSGVGFTVKTQNDRGLFYENFVLKLLECKYCVGFDEFQYRDNEPKKKDADPSNTSSNKGIYSAKGEEYTDFTKHITRVNKAKYSLINFFDERNK